MPDRDTRPHFRPAVETLEGRDVPSSSNSTPLDARYLIQAAQGNVQEVLLGLTAMTRASTPAVRQFGQILVQDHTAAFFALQPLLAAEGITLTTDQLLDDDQRDNIDRFQHLRGGQFDREFAEFMVEDHRDEINAAMRAAAFSPDANVRAAATQMLPALQYHFAIATLEDRAFND